VEEGLTGIRVRINLSRIAERTGEEKALRPVITGDRSTGRQ